MPSLSYVWLGFCCALVPPSPKSHDHVEIDELPSVDWSVKLTVSETVPDVGEPVKAASGPSSPSWKEFHRAVVGWWAKMLFWMVVELLPAMKTASPAPVAWFVVKVELAIVPLIPNSI